MDKTNEYKQYLKSNEWAVKVQQRLRIDNFRCCMCNATGTPKNRLCIHHLHYKSLKNENVWTDLVTLCESCHTLTHRMLNRRTGIDKWGWGTSLPIASVTINKNLIHDYTRD